jgi:flagellar biosynthesis protein FlhF
MINTDTYRIAAQEQIQTYADILEIPLITTYNSQELEEALQSLGDCDIIFIDTAGKFPGDPQHKGDVQSIIAAAQPEDILLCISATTSYSAAQEIIDSYSYLPDYKLMITKLDETRYRGLILSLSWYTHKPIGYVTTGQNVPDDIELLDAVKTSQQILGIQTDKPA